MQHLLGEFDCKIDSKGRFRMPATLLKQFAELEELSFVVNRAFEKCLVLRPRGEWDRITKELSKLNTLKKSNRDFVRYFNRGASEVMLDSAERLLVSKRLAEYAGFEKEIVLIAYFQKIEIWSKVAYESMMEEEPEDFAAFTESVFGEEGDLEGINL